MYVCLGARCRISGSGRSRDERVDESIARGGVSGECGCMSRYVSYRISPLKTLASSAPAAAKQIGSKCVKPQLLCVAMVRLRLGFACSGLQKSHGPLASSWKGWRDRRSVIQRRKNTELRYPRRYHIWQIRERAIRALFVLLLFTHCPFQGKALRRPPPMHTPESKITPSLILLSRPIFQQVGRDARAGRRRSKWPRGVGPLGVGERRRSSSGGGGAGTHS